jgi:hypothetical protein
VERNLESIFHFCQPLNGSLVDPCEEECVLSVGLAEAERGLLCSVTLWVALKIHFPLKIILSLSETEKQVLRLFHHKACSTIYMVTQTAMIFCPGHQKTMCQTPSVGAGQERRN